jgi:hypothetical protein
VVLPIEEQTEVPKAVCKTFRRLVTTGTAKSNDYRFCYFIDGLDEYDGDNQQYLILAKTLATWGNCIGVKLVCSSRPYTVFRDVFRIPGAITIELHNLTRKDIQSFASTQFKRNLSGPETEGALTTCLTLADEIVRRADGVFLWAALAVRSLINGAIDGEDTRELEERLRDYPDGLQKMFAKMLGNVDPSPSVRRRSNTVMYLAVHNPLGTAMNAIAFSWLGDLE